MKFFKTLILSIVALGAVTVSSCTKDNNDATTKGTLTATVDGKVTVFSKNVLGATSTVNGSTFTSIQGTDDAGNTISITVLGVLTPGRTFSSTAADDKDKPIVTYTTSGDVSFINDDSDASKIVTVAVSSAASNTIQGTFSGKLQSTTSSNDPTFASRTITDGKFNVSLTQ